MAILTYKNAFLTSALLSVVSTRGLPQYAPFSGLAANFWGCFGVLFSIVFMWNSILYPKLFSPLRHLPSPTGGTFLNGQFWRIFAEETGGPHREWLKTVPNDGIIKYNVLLNKERIFLTSPKALGEVLVTRNYEFVKPDFFAASLTKLLGNGILFAEGDEHKRQRRNLMPAFSFRHVKDLYPIFWAKGVEVVEAMTQSLRHSMIESTPSGVVDVHAWASRVTLDIIGVAGIGHDFGAVQDEDSKLYRTYRSVFKMDPNQRAMQALSIILGPYLFGKLPTKRNREVVEARDLIRGVCQDLINEKRTKLAKGVVEKDILSVAIESGGFNDSELIDQLMTFLAAGHETTASAMLWAVYHLCAHPDVQTRLREEIRASLPSPSSEKGSVITHEDIDKLPYLNAVCSEVLRITPSVPLTLRTAAHDTTILDHPIPKGTSIIAVAWAVNTSTELWGPDAATFNPDRWIEGPRAHSGGADRIYSFLTFLHGPRSCIGQKFAQAEFACLLASWVGRFEMSNVEGGYKLEVGGGITSKPKNFQARLKVVEGW